MTSPLLTSAPTAPANKEVTFENDIIFHGLAAFLQTRDENPDVVPLDDFLKYEPGKGPFIVKMTEIYQNSMATDHDDPDKKHSYEQRRVAYDSMPKL